MLYDGRSINPMTVQDETSGTAGGAAPVRSDDCITVGQRVRFVGNRSMTTWSMPCIGATGRLTRRNVTISEFTGKAVILWVFEPEIRGKCLPAWMYVRSENVRPIGEDAPAQGEASLLGDCSYDAMLRKAGIDKDIANEQPFPNSVAFETGQGVNV